MVRGIWNHFRLFPPGNTVAGEKSAFSLSPANPPASLHLFCFKHHCSDVGGRMAASLAIPSGPGATRTDLTAVDQQLIAVLRAHSGSCRFNEELDTFARAEDAGRLLRETEASARRSSLGGPHSGIKNSLRPVAA